MELTLEYLVYFSNARLFHSVYIKPVAHLFDADCIPNRKAVSIEPKWVPDDNRNLEYGNELSSGAPVYGAYRQWSCGVHFMLLDL